MYKCRFYTENILILSYLYKYRIGLYNFLWTFFCFALSCNMSIAKEPYSAADKPTYSILFLGDTYFGESYQEKRAKQGKENVLETRGRSALIAPFAGLLAEANLTIANLETAVTDRDVSPYEGVKLYIHRAEPEATMAQLISHGVDAVSLGNNHSLDYGAPGLADTLKTLDGGGIAHCGANFDLKSARRPVMLEIPGVQSEQHLAVFCPFWRDEGYLKLGGLYAAPGEGGVAPLETEALAEQVRDLRATAPKALIVVFPHWGWNYYLAFRAQQEIARTLIDAGADLIVGHGAHIFQEIERYHDRWILYGLGNFVFASEGRYEKFNMPPYSIIARLMLNNDGSPRNLRLYPIVTNNLLTDFHPSFTTQTEFSDWHKLLKSYAVGWSLDGISTRQTDQYGAYLALPFR
jgi:hypothetical protein